MNGPGGHGGHYQRLKPELRALTVSLISTEFFEGSGPGKLCKAPGRL